jgi:hypothetical protein
MADYSWPNVSMLEGCGELPLHARSVAGTFYLGSRTSALVIRVDFAYLRYVRYPAHLGPASSTLRTWLTHDHSRQAAAWIAASGLRQNNSAGNISLNLSGKSLLQIRPSHPARGAYRDRHERGMGCGGRGSVGRDTRWQGGLAKGP